jgi:hypothetical protein
MGSLVTQDSRRIIAVDVQPFYEGGKIVDRQIRVQLECGCGMYVAIPLSENPPSVGQCGRCSRPEHRA